MLKNIKGKAMRSLLLASLCTVSIFAADTNLYNHSVSVGTGYTINSNETGMDNDENIAIRYNYNRATIEGSAEIDAIQVAFDYSNDTPYNNPAEGIIDAKSSTYRLGANAIWYIENDSDFTPFALAGLGIQGFSESTTKDSDSTLFGALGGGVEYQIRGDVSIVAEGKALMSKQDSYNVMGNAAIKYSFGQDY